MKTKSTLTTTLGAMIIAATTAFAQDPVPIYPDNYKVLFENDRVRVLDFMLRKGATEQFHAHPAAVTYVLSPFKIRFSFPDGTTKIREAKAGDVLYGEAVVHSPENIGETDAHGILVEMKTPSKETGAVNAVTGLDFLTALTFVRGQEGSEEELKRELLSTTVPTRSEPGNLLYDLYQSPEHKNEFMRLEIWRSPEALKEHKQSPPLKASFERRQAKGWTTEITTWKRVPDTNLSAALSK